MNNEKTHCGETDNEDIVAERNYQSEFKIAMRRERYASDHLPGVADFF
jgi:hypothetical protein